MRDFQSPKELKNQTQIHYDTRGLVERIIADYLSDRKIIAPLVILTFGILGFVVPATLPVFSVLGYITLALILSNREKLPMKLPKGAKGFDYNSPYPGGRTAFRKGEGIFLLGYEDGTNEQIWASTTEILRHMLILGVTGAGKTEALLGLVANSLGIGAGAIYCDAKATVKLLWQIYALACITGRVDDFLAINYITGGLSQHRIKEIGRITNSVQPFSIGSADGILQLLTSIMPGGGGGGGNEVFRERAIAIMAALLKAMEEYRDRYNEPISADAIRLKLDIKVFYAMSQDERLSDVTKAAVTEYLKKLPGWDDAKPLQENLEQEQVVTQFGFAQMYWTRSLAQLADSYKHIYGDNHGEIDFADVVLNRRILLVMLPALEKSQDELGQLGKLNLAALKGAMSIGLGMRVQGTKQDVLDPLPAAEEVPSIGIFDEYGYMAAPGFAVSAAQARGLGFGAIFAGQGLAGFQALNPGESGRLEVEQIIDNTRLKIAMGIEDAEKSFGLFQKIAGDMEVSKESSYEMNSIGNAIASRKTSLQKESRINIRDVREQIEGEAHVFWMGRILRMDFFHADPKIPKKNAVMLNHGVKINIDTLDSVKHAIENEIKGMKNLEQTLLEYRSNPAPIDSRDAFIANVLDSADKKNGDEGLAVEFIIKMARELLAIKSGKNLDSSPSESKHRNDPEQMAPPTNMDIVSEKDVFDEEEITNPMDPDHTVLNQGMDDNEIDENPDPEMELSKHRRETVLESLNEEDLDPESDGAEDMPVFDFEPGSPAFDPSEGDRAVEDVGRTLGVESGIESVTVYPEGIDKPRDGSDEADVDEITREIERGIAERLQEKKS